MVKELNPFEIKAELIRIISKYSKKYSGEISPADFDALDSSNKNIIARILFKELINIKAESENIVRILLGRYVEKEELTNQLWNILKNNLASVEAKIIVLNFLRDLETDWKYEDYESFVGNADDIIDEDTRQLLDKAIVNPEVQIDFLDFLSAVNEKDKVLLIKSLAEDYDRDALANILIPVFLSQPDSETGREALSILGNSKSQLAYHALNTAYNFVSDSMKPLIKKNLSTLKLSGIREDNSQEFYKNLLSESRPYRCCATYPDGHGNQALIFSRTNKEKRVQFVAVVINDYNGIRDCFGFNDISQFECDKIIERFYKEEESLNIPSKALKTILMHAEALSKQKASNWLLPYEYVCWKNLLADIEYDNDDYLTILTSMYPPQNAKLENFDVMTHWFLDSHYSSEVEEFFDNLNEKVKDDLKSLDFDRCINEHLNEIFYPEEKDVWHKRLLTCAYLKMLDNKDTQAANILAIYNDKSVFEEILKNILRKSIYEYYFTLKYNTEENNDKFTLKELDAIIEKIEDKWVQNV